MKLLIDIPEDMYTHVSTSDAYVLDDTDWILLENAIANGVPLDGLTNGEVHQKVFISLNTKVGAKKLEVYLDSDTECVGCVDFDWWNRKWGE